MRRHSGESRPELLDQELGALVRVITKNNVDCNSQFAQDVLAGDINGLSLIEMRGSLEFIADWCLASLRLPLELRARNPFDFMTLRDMKELTILRAPGHRLPCRGHRRGSL